MACRGRKVPGYRSHYLRLSENVPEGELRCGILSGQSQLEGPQEKEQWAEGRASCRESVMRLLMGSFPPRPTLTPKASSHSAYHTSQGQKV